MLVPRVIQRISVPVVQELLWNCRPDVSSIAGNIADYEINMIPVNLHYFTSDEPGDYGG